MLSYLVILFDLQLSFHISLVILYTIPVILSYLLICPLMPINTMGIKGYTFQISI
jgi:hypothetical protein